MITLLDRWLFSLLRNYMSYLDASQWSFGISLTVGTLVIYFGGWYALEKLSEWWDKRKEQK